MKSSRVQALMLAAFVLTLGAGIVAGLLGSRLPSAGGEPAHLAEELQLSPEQRVRMRQIWEGVRDTGHNCLEEARSLQSRRDKAIQSLLNEEQKKAYAKIEADYSASCAGLIARREAAFRQAVQKTKEILTPAQRVKYDTILKARLGPDAEHGKTQMLGDPPGLPPPGPAIGMLPDRIQPAANEPPARASRSI